MRPWGEDSLFPLEVVLFPQIPLPLHIFEERYKLMMGSALRRIANSGWCISTEQGEEVGCTAKIRGCGNGTMTAGWISLREVRSASCSKRSPMKNLPPG